MRKIEVFYDGTRYTYRWIRALLWAKEKLKENGVYVHINGDKFFDGYVNFVPFTFDEQKYIQKIKKGNFDIIMLAYHWKSDFGRLSAEKKAKLLKLTKSRCNQLVWLDTADSTGTCRFEVLPYVDRYLKKQRMKDISLYTRDWYGGRYFCDYYHKKYKLEDEELSRMEFTPLDMKYADKIGISWNVGVSDIFTVGKLNQVKNIKRYDNYTYLDPNSERCYDTFFKGSKYSPIIGWQRKVTKDTLSAHKEIKNSGIQRTPRKEYLREEALSKTIISPFGFGEICTRDFEAFLFGAALIKPDMQEIVTYPDWFIPNKTYIPIDWDFETLMDILYGIQKEPERYKEIAENGQRLYRDTMSEEGKIKFVHHLLEELGIS